MTWDWIRLASLYCYFICCLTIAAAAAYYAVCDCSNYTSVAIAMFLCHCECYIPKAVLRNNYVHVLDY